MLNIVILNKFSGLFIFLFIEPVFQINFLLDPKNSILDYG